MVSTALLKLVESPAEPKIEIRYAETDEELCAIHRFLMIVAQQAGALRCPVDIYDSLSEITRVAKEDAAIMVLHNGVLVGTMGLMKAKWWYGKGFFMTDRWHFVLPAFMHTPTAKALMDDAKEIARIAGLEFVHNGKLRETKDGVLRLIPRVHLPETE